MGALAMVKLAAETSAVLVKDGDSVTAGQVLVLHDMLGLNLGKMPKFVRNFMAELPGTPGQHGIKEAMQAYVAAVKSGSFPNNAQHAW